MPFPSGRSPSNPLFSFFDWLIGVSLHLFTPLSQKVQGKRSSDPVRMGVII